MGLSKEGYRYLEGADRLIGIYKCINSCLIYTPSCEVPGSPLSS